MYLVICHPASRVATKISVKDEIDKSSEVQKQNVD